ncbi:MAG: DNA-packaging protein [Clostridiales bacterium]|nr:DNA-packaging protein [Clostridiales bacterium]
MLTKVRLALRITTTAFDSEINDLIDAALADLALAGVTQTDTENPLIIRAVCTYCRLHFGDPDDPERLKASYDEQKAQMQTATGFTDWGDEMDG